MLSIGLTKKSQKLIFFEEKELLCLIPVNSYNLYKYFKYKNGKKIQAIDFVIKKNGNFIKCTKQKLFKEEDNFENMKKEIIKEHGESIVNDKIFFNVSEIKNLNSKELDLFRYIPSIKEYSYNELQLDPYYIGFWLGDGHTDCPGRFTVGDGCNGNYNDESIIIPYMKDLASKLNLDLNQVKNTITWTLSSGKKGYTSIDNSIFSDNWLSEWTKICEELKRSKETKSRYHNYQDNYDPVKKYLINNNNYKCTHKINKKIYKAKNKDETIIFDNFKDLSDKIGISQSVFYSILNGKRKNNYWNGWEFSKDTISLDCNFDSANSKIRYENTSIKKNNQYIMFSHIKNIHPDIKIKNSKESWNDMSEEEKETWKTCEIKKDICKKYKKDWVTVWKNYKIYKTQGLEKYREEKLKKCNPINLVFYNLGLNGKKLIPECYLKTSIENRKKILAGIIDSDGSKSGSGWDITLKLENLIDDIEILAKSLGMFTYRTTRNIILKNSKMKEPKPYFRIKITPVNNWDIPVLLERKKIIKKPDIFPKIYKN